MNRFILLSFILCSWITGCAPETPLRQGPPEGWDGIAAKWWVAGQDTSAIFRNLETLEDLEVVEGEGVFLASGSVARLDAREEFERAVKRSLIRLFRNEPAIVDSLFEAFLVPKIQTVKFTNDPIEDVEKFKKNAYKVLARHFREPRTKLALGTDVPVVYPDSLREQGIGGDVKLQVFLNEEGEPQSVELLEGVHPVLDQIAMDATTQMRWIPGYVEHKRDWKAIPSWARFRITFTTSNSRR